MRYYFCKAVIWVSSFPFSYCFTAVFLIFFLEIGDFRLKKGGEEQKRAVFESQYIIYNIGREEAGGGNEKEHGGRNEKEL